MNKITVTSGRNRTAASPRTGRAAFVGGSVMIALMALLTLAGYSPKSSHSLDAVEETARSVLAEEPAVAAFLSLEPSSEGGAVTPGVTSSGEWDLWQYLTDVLGRLLFS